MMSEVKKKVGIITFHFADNFGAVFQAYALQEVVSKLGYDVEIIDFRPTSRTTVSRSARLKFILRSVGRRILLGKKLSKCKVQYELFRQSFMKLSRYRYKSSQDLLNNPPIYDIYLVGSDQVWNPTFVKNLGFSYLLDFLPPTVYKISYASSVVERIPDEMKTKYKELLEQFQFISVRERSSREILEEFLSKPIEICLDPVFLIDQKSWQKLCQHPNHVPKTKFILAIDYDLSENYIRYTNRIAGYYNLPVVFFRFNLPFLKRYKNQYSMIGYEGPAQILWYIMNAEAVLTSSFHGLAFSLIFDKKFVCLVHRTRGNRMVDLLRELGLEDTMVYHFTDVNSTNAKPKFMSDSARNKLNTLKINSMEYLKRALSCMQR